MASIDRGLLVFIGVRPKDDAVSAVRLIRKVLHYRVFADVNGKMTLDLQQIDG